MIIEIGVHKNFAYLFLITCYQLAAGVTYHDMVYNDDNSSDKARIVVVGLSNI